MSAEFWLSVGSLVLTTAVGVLTIILNVRISKINNTKDLHTYEKHITPFELQFRDEEWLYDLIINRDEFDHYDEPSKKRIVKWFEEYAKTHNLTKLKVSNSLQKQEEVKEEITAELSELTQSEEKPVEIEKPAKRRGRPKKANNKVVKLGNGREIVLTPEMAKLIAEARLGASLGNQGVVRPGVLRNYPIKDSTITPTPIITDLEDEFDEEDKK